MEQGYAQTDCPGALGAEGGGLHQHAYIWIGITVTINYAGFNTYVARASQTKARACNLSRTSWVLDALENLINPLLIRPAGLSSAPQGLVRNTGWEGRLCTSSPRIWLGLFTCWNRSLTPSLWLCHRFPHPVQSRKLHTALCSSQSSSSMKIAL